MVKIGGTLLPPNVLSMENVRENKHVGGLFWHVQNVPGGVIVPDALTFGVENCDVPNCDSVHIIPYTKEGEPLCEVTLHLVQLQKIVEVLLQRKVRDGT